ncbi:hypothetical protein L2729_18160 [Shewanella gelidimarina]|uniref:hypothetical protein n=1 Tax=Shewanella gelidimarina TaxID=56813 RepID=UPI00200FA8DE|nr:hypothetical protein [Shewanella gelidimarina]MCL1059897.1 hypothetical protein [Shewanella gelidimarina]
MYDSVNFNPFMIRIFSTIQYTQSINQLMAIVVILKPLYGSVKGIAITSVVSVPSCGR